MAIREAVEQRPKAQGACESYTGTGVAKACDETRWPALTSEQRKLVTRHIRLVRVHLRSRVPTPRHPTRLREYDDLFQEGCVALARAAKRYSADTDGPFAAYALPRIRGAIFTALHDRFCIIRIPTRILDQHKKRGQGGRPLTFRPLDRTVEETSPSLAAEARAHEDGETIRHAIRRRYELAVARALQTLRNRKWRRRNPYDIMVRMAAERLLISQEKERTPLRQIARETSVSSSRASAYEQRLLDTIEHHFQSDPHLPLLVRFARQGSAGMDTILNGKHREQLASAELDAFDHTFANLGRGERARLIYDLIEQTSRGVAEVARNLYRLSRPISTESDALLPQMA